MRRNGKQKDVERDTLDEGRRGPEKNVKSRRLMSANYTKTRRKKGDYRKQRERTGITNALFTNFCVE